MQKALPSSNQALFKLCLFLVAAVALASACGIAERPQSPPPAAQTGSGGEAAASPAGAAAPVEGETSGPSGPAVLQTGPVERRGIIILPANAIRYQEGVYLHGGFTITVRYTQEDIVLPSGWVTRRCGALPVSFTIENGILHYAHESEEGWHLFFAMPEGYGSDCAFIERFMQRLRYFKSVTDSREYVPYPAILELI